MELKELEKLVKERRTIRKWKKQEVSDDLIRKAVEVATWAPNGGNFQGWRFVVVKNREVIVKMADAVRGKQDCVLAGITPLEGGYGKIPDQCLLLQECASLYRCLRRSIRQSLG